MYLKMSFYLPLSYLYYKSCYSKLRFIFTWYFENVTPLSSGHHYWGRETVCWAKCFVLYLVYLSLWMLVRFCFFDDFQFQYDGFGVWPQILSRVSIHLDFSREILSFSLHPEPLQEYLIFIHSFTEDATFLVWPYLKGLLLDFWHATWSSFVFWPHSPSHTSKIKVMELAMNNWISLEKLVIWCFTIFLPSENFS